MLRRILDTQMMMKESTPNSSWNKENVPASTMMRTAALNNTTATSSFLSSPLYGWRDLKPPIKKKSSDIFSMHSLQLYA
eukprot:scaffold860_cov72-Skeletonema_dohrnii-CCMP3373.AAC.2